MIHDCLSGSSNNRGVGPKFPGWCCSTVWTPVSSRWGLVVEFGWARVRLGLPSFALSPTFSPTLPLSPSPSPPPLSSHPQKLRPSRGFMFQLYPGSCPALALRYCDFCLLSVCPQPDSSDPLPPTALALHPRLC